MFQNSCWKVSKQGTDGVRTRDLRFTRPTPYHLATAPDKCAFFWLQSTPFFPWILFSHGREFEDKKKCGSGGIRTHASEETGALNQRLRPLGHATYYMPCSLQIWAFTDFLHWKFNSWTVAKRHLDIFHKKLLSEVGFEPTPSYEDQNSLCNS